MKNVTITLDEEVARWARVQAAERKTSLSRLVGQLLRNHMKEEQAFEAAMKRHLSRTPKRLKRRGAPYPGRENIHERSRLR